MALVNPDYRLIEGPYVRELLDQPEALWETAQALAGQDLGDLPGRLSYGAFDRIVLTGMGSSLQACKLVPPTLATTGLPLLVIETAELAHTQAHLLSSKSLLLIVSQSGRSAEVLRLLQRLPEGCRCAAITNTPDSPLGQRAEPVILTCAGDETTIACKTYTATVLALLWLMEVIRGGQPQGVAERLSRTAEAFADYLSWWRDHVEALAGSLSESRQAYLLGRGASLAAAGAGALTIKEAARFPAEAMSSAGFRHGPLELAGPETGVFILEGTGSLAALNQRFVSQLQDQGSNAFLVARQSAVPPLKLPDVSDDTLPLVEILPFQMISVALAALASHEAGHFLHAKKITDEE